jgi:dCTP diphosphatase
MLERPPADSWQAGPVTDYDQLHRDIRAFSAERDWGRFHDPKSLLIAMMGEVGEVAELLQWLPADGAAGLVADEPLHGRIADELADVFIYLVYLADACGVELVPAAVSKLAAAGRKYPVAQFRGQIPERPAGPVANGARG